MDEKWRLLNTGASDAATNMAMDEAILTAHIKEKTPPTIRFYSWNPSAVSIGFFQSIEQEVNLNACRELGVDVVRRITGGGAVYHDRDGEITYSIVMPDRHRTVSPDFIETYKSLCQGLINGLALLNIEAKFTPINDITVQGRKISGNAQTRRRGSILQHGTLLLKTDASLIFKLLKVSDEKMSDKAVRSFEDRVTNLYREGQREISQSEVSDALKQGFEDTLDIKLAEDKLNPVEIEEARRTRLKFSSKEWNFQR